MTPARCKTAILISGSGSNLQSFIDRVADGQVDLDLTVVFSNRPDAFGLQRASAAGIDTACIEHGGFKSREEFDMAVSAALDRWQPELLVLAGFMRILSPWFVDRYRGRILNIHPALLPKFGGKGMYGKYVHEAVSAAGESVTGITIHMVNEHYDEGAIVAQYQVEITPGEAAQSIEEKVRELEYVQAARALGYGNVRILFRHVLPNVFHLVIINFSLTFVTAIKSEVILTFLGVGVDKEPSWGQMIADAKNELMRGIWWPLLFSGVALFLLTLAVNYVGDALRDALDPKLANEG